METRAHHVFIGLFLVVAIAGILLFSLWLGKSSSKLELVYYDVLFNEEVSGLTAGSAVEFSGIKVGEVESLQLDQQDPRKVWARIRLSGGTPVKQDTHARLSLANITGSALIRLFGGSPNSPILQGIDGKNAVIIADKSPISRLLANGENLMGNIDSMANNLNKMLSDENVRSLSLTLSHLEQVTEVFASHRNDLAETTRQISTLSQQASAVMTDISHLTKNTDKLLDNQGRNVLNSTALSMANLERVTHQLEQLLNNNQAPLQNGMQSLNNLGPALQELRAALSSLNRLSHRLEEDPSGFLLDREKKQEFQP
jgi:phospholipid/cholesterol/gamma-HCH transport system substrate-binding protein